MIALRSTSVRLVVAIGVAAGLAQLAPAAAQPAPSAAAAPGWITGTVVDRHGDPIKGVLVNVLGPREVPEVGIIAAETDRRDWTNARGTFKVRQAKNGFLVQICQPQEPGADTCRETAQGVDHLITYVGPTGVTDSWVTQNRLFAASGSDLSLGSTTVKQQGFVSGRIKGASLQFVRLLRLNDTVAFTTETDAQGDYRFQGLAPGEYRIAAGGSGWLPWRSKVISVVADQTVEQNGRIHKGGRLSGVLTAQGKPVAFTDVMVLSGGEPYAAATTNRKGVYRVSGLTEGSYRVGITYDGSPYQRTSQVVHVPSDTAVLTHDIRARKGAVITLKVSGVGAGADFRDELRGSDGRPILGLSSLGRGEVTYTGLSKGTYTFVGANEKRYVKKRIVVTKAKRYDVGTLRMKHATFTLSGTTAPRAVVEATTADLCLPDAPDLPGSFHQLERADAHGRYRITGLVPGRYMLGSDGWPGNFVPRCWDGVRIKGDLERDLPLAEGGTVSGRMVDEATGTPIITYLSYALTYPNGSPGQPTDEHPSRDQSKGATGEFFVDALGADTVVGQLSQGIRPDEQITDGEFLVIYPFQDGTPYYLTSPRQEIEVGPGLDVDLGDVPVTLHGGP